MTRRRVAVVSSCCPPLPGHPVTGGGLRTAQLLDTLATGKHSVIPVIEAAALPSKGVPKAWRRFTDDLPAVLRAIKPDVIVLEQWALASRLGDPAHGGAPDVPLVIDLHGSLMLENVYRRGSMDLTLDAKTKLEALRRADLLLTPAPDQLHHFASWASLAGFDARELPLELMPLATSSVAAARTGKKPALRMVYGGARWPWIDSLAWLEVAADAAEKAKGAALDVFTYEPPRHGLPFEEDLGSWPDVDTALGGRSKGGVRLHGRTEHAAFLEVLRTDATVALDLWEPNPERMLASTTRTVEFLAAGLPVITVQGACWAEELVQSGAGWTVAPGDRASLSVLLAKLAAEPGLIAAASKAALALARQRADLAVSGAALLAFVNKPSRPPRAPRSLVEAIVHVRQTHLDETLRSLQAAHETEHAALVAAHKADTAQLADQHRAEVQQLRAQHQAEVLSLRAAGDAHVGSLTERHDAQVEELRKTQQAMLDRADAQHREAAAQQQAQMQAATDAHRDEVARLTAERSAEMAKATQRHEAALTSLRAQAQTEASDLRAELDGVRAEAAEAAEAARTRLNDSIADKQGELDGARDALAARDQELRAMTESRDELQGRWKADRAQDKEARTRLEVEMRAQMTAREEELRVEADARVEALRAELTGQLDAMAARKVVRLADSVQGVLGGERQPRGGDGPGRVLPAMRLAKLWAEHALDRERD